MIAFGRKREEEVGKEKEDMAREMEKMIGQIEAMIRQKEEVRHWVADVLERVGWPFFFAPDTQPGSARV